MLNKASVDETSPQNTYNGKIFDYGLRIKNVESTNIVKECTMDPAVILKLKNSDNTYF